MTTISFDFIVPNTYLTAFIFFDYFGIMHKNYFDKSLLLEGKGYLYAYNNNNESEILLL